MAVSVSIAKLDALTNKHFVKRLEDNVFLSNILWMYMKKRVKEAGGRDIRVPITHSKNDTVGRWNMGGEQVDTTGQDNQTTAVFPWRGYKAALVLNNTDIAQNSGAEQIVDLIEAETENAQDSLMDKLDIDSFLAGESTDSGETKAGIQGLLAAISKGANNVSGGYGGITRVGASGGKNSPTGNAFWNSAVQAANSNSTVTHWRTSMTMDNSTVLTLAKLFELAGVLAQPDLFVTSQTIYNKYASLLTTIQREMVDEEVGKAGFTSLQFNFKPFVVAENIDAVTSIYALTMRYWDLYVLRGYNFKATPFKTPINQDSIVKHIFFVGNMVCRRPNAQALLTGVTAS